MRYQANGRQRHPGTNLRWQNRAPAIPNAMQADRRAEHNHH